MALCLCGCGEEIGKKKGLFINREHYNEYRLRNPRPLKQTITACLPVIPANDGIIPAILSELKLKDVLSLYLQTEEQKTINSRMSELIFDLRVVLDRYDPPKVIKPTERVVDDNPKTFILEDGTKKAEGEMITPDLISPYLRSSKKITNPCEKIEEKEEPPVENELPHPDGWGFLRVN